MRAKGFIISPKIRIIYTQEEIFLFKSIKSWIPDTPYLDVMKEAGLEQAYPAYLAQRSSYAESPSFFLDCGDYFLTNGQNELGIRVLSNLAELGLDDAALLRMYAWRLQQADELDLAIAVFERVHASRGDEPQSFRDLALALGLRWERDHDSDDLTQAMNLFYEVVLREWERFPEIEIIALMELNRLIRLAKQENVPVPEHIDQRLQRNLDLDVRISMSWDADLTDVDLHVFEPTEEHAYYSHNLTAIGGLVSRDFTQGYGPEEYVLRRALPGTYTIKAHYYGSSQQALCGPCTVAVMVFTNYARADEKKQVLMLRLDKPSDEVRVGEIAIDGEEQSDTEGGEDTSWQGTFKQLRHGMTVDEIVGVVGQPIEIRGKEEMTMVYRPETDIEIHVRTGPGLIAVQRIMEGAVLDIL